MELLYLGILFAVIIVLFAVLKRPMYEVMMVGLVVLAIISGNIGNIGEYFVVAGGNYLLYTIIGFIAFSVILERTGIIYDFVNVIIAIVGRFSGGAGYVAVIASSLFGALSGTGPGNAAAIGVIAIPAMTKTGFSKELAASVEMAASALGPAIPPSGSIPASFAIMIAMYPNCCTFSEFWLMSWGIALWFILHRLVMCFILVKRYKIGPIPKEDRPTVREALKKGWKAMLLPVIVFLPFLLDAMFSATLITDRIGADGAAAFTSCLLAIVPSVCIAFAIAINRDPKNKITLRSFAKLFEESAKDIAPVAVTVLAGFMLGELFADIGIGEGIARMIEGVDISLVAVAILLPLALGVLGMFLEAMSIIYTFQTACLIIGAAAGMNPVLLSSLMTIMTVSLGHMTPPFSLTLYVSMGIAGAEFSKTAKIAVLWCIGHYLITVLMLLGIIPIPGMVSYIP